MTPSQQGTGARANPVERKPSGGVQVTKRPSDLLPKEFTDDEVARFFFDNWRNLVLLIAAACAVWFLVESFRSTRAARQRNAGEVFGGVQLLYNEYVQARNELNDFKATIDGTNPAKLGLDGKPLPDAEKEAKEKLPDSEKRVTDSRTKLDGALTALREAGAPYATLSGLYAGLAALQSGDAAAAEKELAPSLAWKRDSIGSADRMYHESGALAWGRFLLDAPTRAAEGRKILEELAQSGDVAHVGAVLTLSEASLTPEERKQTLALIDALVARAPEQADLVKDARERLARAVS